MVLEFLSGQHKRPQYWESARCGRFDMSGVVTVSPCYLFPNLAGDLFDDSVS